MADDTKDNPAVPDRSKLITAIAARQDKTAFAELFAHFAPRIKSMLVRGGAPADTAEDLAQEAMLSVWRKASYFDAGRASASTWIFTIARNLRIDAARREQRARLHETVEQIEPEGPETPDQLLDASERQVRVREAMKKLSEEQLQVIKLSFVEGKSHGEIAELLGLPLGTVKSRVRLAMSRLRQHLEDMR